MKKCSKCKTEKTLEDFYNYHKSKDGKTPQCKACMTAYRKQNKEKQRQYMQQRRLTDNESIKETRRKSWRNLDPRKRMLQQSRNRAKRKGIEHNISLEDIIVPEMCPLLGVPFIVGTKDNYEHTHSLDRMDPTKGYVKGNVWVITKKANSMKNSATRKELLYFAKQINIYFSDDIV
jgi:hypothetical protein